MLKIKNMKTGKIYYWNYRLMVWKALKGLVTLTAILIFIMILGIVGTMETSHLVN